MSNPTKYYSNMQESKIAEDLGWDVVAGSGAAPCTPGDIISDEWLGECKTHVNTSKSIYFNHDVWDKICAESTFKHRKPVLFTDDGSQRLSNTWCVCAKLNIETESIYQIPFTVNIKKNISFDHSNLIAEYNRARRILPEIFRGCAIVYSATWLGQDIFVMPYESFKQIIEVQG